MVVLDFADKKKVTEAWAEYLDKLNTPEPTDEAQKPRFWEDRDAKFLAWIYAMTQALNYQTTALDVKRQYYSPIAHGTWAEQETILRQGITSLFRDQKPIPIRLVQDK